MFPVHVIHPTVFFDVQRLIDPHDGRHVNITLTLFKAIPLRGRTVIIAEVQLSDVCPVGTGESEERAINLFMCGAKRIGIDRGDEAVYILTGQPYILLSPPAKILFGDTFSQIKDALLGKYELVRR